MKRNVALALLVTAIAAVSLLFMPPGLSRQAEANAPGKEGMPRKKGERVEISGLAALMA